MNVHEAIFARRAVRAYTSGAVEEETIRSLLRAAVQAPSAMNRQPWLFAVVEDRARLRRYSERAKAMLLEAKDAKTSHYAAMLRDPSFNIFYDAGCLVAIGVGETTAYSAADCWLAASNLMLGARDRGLGTCCIGFAIPILNTPDVKAELGFPRDGAVIAPIILGHPAVEPPAVARALPNIVSWSR
jgi:nitroreductase